MVCTKQLLTLPLGGRGIKICCPFNFIQLGFITMLSQDTLHPSRSAANSLLNMKRPTNPTSGQARSDTVIAASLPFPCPRKEIE